MGQVRKRGGVYWVRYYRNGQRLEQHVTWKGGASIIAITNARIEPA